jgi:hypothetical protein
MEGVASLPHNLAEAQMVLTLDFYPSDDNRTGCKCIPGSCSSLKHSLPSDLARAHTQPQPQRRSLRPRRQYLKRIQAQVS